MTTRTPLETHLDLVAQITDERRQDAQRTPDNAGAVDGYLLAVGALADLIVAMECEQYGLHAEPGDDAELRSMLGAQFREKERAEAERDRVLGRFVAFVGSDPVTDAVNTNRRLLAERDARQVEAAQQQAGPHRV